MKKVWFKTLLICSLVVFTYHHSLADDDAPATSEFSNPAQAAHAANLSEEASAALDGNVENAENDLEKVNTDLETAQTAKNNAKNTLDNLPGTATPQEIADAQAALDHAEKALGVAQTTKEIAQNALDQAVGELAGVSEKAVGDMRNSGMGWGQIAHELGVHPGVLGLGHMKHFTIDIATDLPAPELEIAEATRRDVKHGWAKGHGMATSVASSSKKGLGLAETDLGIGSKGSKASKGISGSKSSSSRSGSSSKSSSASSSKGNSKSDRGAAGGPSNDKGNSGNSSSGKSKSDRGKSGGPSNDKSNNGNNGNDKGNSGDKGNKGGNSGKSK